MCLYVCLDTCLYTYLSTGQPNGAGDRAVRRGWWCGGGRAQHARTQDLELLKKSAARKLMLDVVCALAYKTNSVWTRSGPFCVLGHVYTLYKGTGLELGDLALPRGRRILVVRDTYSVRGKGTVIGYGTVDDRVLHCLFFSVVWRAHS